MIDLYTYLGDDDDIDILVVAVSEVSLHSNDLQVFCSFLCSHHQAYLQGIIWVLSAVRYSLYHGRLR